MSPLWATKNTCSRLVQLFTKQFRKGHSRNFALKLSEKPHERAKRLTIKRVIAT